MANFNDHSTVSISRAIQDFRSARQKATLREVIARFTGNSTELLSFDDVRQKLHAQVLPNKELKDIPIDAIVGSVNRYQDFSRDFLPGKNIGEERWANIEMANYGLQGLPPIEAYQIDQVYFVSDGNHRVSVARQLGASMVQAYVTLVQARVPLTADISPEELILKSEYTEFLQHTNLDQLRPGADLSVTETGQYEVVEEHIEVHRYFMGLEQKREIPLAEAATDWYDTVYLPVVDIIREQGLLQDFPSRTELDLYLWIAEHRAVLQDELQSQVEVISAVDDLADQFSQRPYRVIARIGNRIIKAVVPTVLEGGPPTGEWREKVQSSQKSDRLFGELLVPVNGLDDGWFALDQALIVAHKENASLHGFYIQGTDIGTNSPKPEDIQQEFIDRCQAAGVNGDFLVKNGDITTEICERARWNDLVIINLSYPPESSMFARLSSGIRSLVQRCPRPILFTPQTSSPLAHVLLAYDGSLKAQEALFIAAYLGAKWSISLSVITIGNWAETQVVLEDAQKYLELHNVTAKYNLIKSEDQTGSLLDFAAHHDSDLLLIGGYSRNPLLEVLQGGDVDQLLRQSELPILICR